MATAAKTQGYCNIRCPPDQNNNRIKVDIDGKDVQLQWESHLKFERKIQYSLERR